MAKRHFMEVLKDMNATKKQNQRANIDFYYHLFPGEKKLARRRKR